MTDWYKIKRVLIWQNGEEKQIYPAAWWKPWANTVAYYPLKSNFNDASWNGRNLSNSWATITTLGWVPCAYYNWSSYSSNSWYSLTYPRTISLWGYNTNTTSNYYWWLIHISNNSITSAPSWSLWIQYIWSWTVTPADWSSTSAEIRVSISSWWHNIVCTENTSRLVTIYVDWTYKWATTYSTPAQPNWWAIWCKFDRLLSEKLKWYLSNIILENKVRTAQEISDYYNQTKSNYGL